MTIASKSAGAAGPNAAALGQAYRLAQDGRVAEAAVLLTRLAGSGDAGAMTMLGEMRWSGGLDQDPVAARRLFEEADARGNATAQVYVTNLLASGIAGRRDWSAALARLDGEAGKHRERAAARDLLGRMKLDADGDPLSLPAPRIIAERPDVRLVERLLTATECDYLRARAEPNFRPSTVYDPSRKLVRDPIRTSDGATLAWLIEDPAVHALNRRLAAASGTSTDAGEALQILRYRPGQQYKLHLDFLRGSDNQRHVTVLVWLNHDYRGGETVFPRADIKVRGRKGDALIFVNALPDRRPDPLTEHAGLPVTAGEKYLASRWIHEKRWAP